MQDAIDLMNEGKLTPAVMVTHVGGLDSAAETTVNLPKIPGGKKLVYTHINMPMTAIEDFRALGEKDVRYKVLADICEQTTVCGAKKPKNICSKIFNSLFCKEAGKKLFSYAKFD